MAINFQCPCGETLAAAEEHAGAQVECPTCAKLLTVPKANAEFDYFESAPLPPAPPPPRKKASLVDKDDEEEDRPRKKKKRKRKNYDDEDEESPQVRAMMDKAHAELDEEEERHRRESRGIHFTPGIMAGLGMFLVGSLACVTMVCIGFISIRLIVICAVFAIIGLVRAILAFKGQGID